VIIPSQKHLFELPDDICYLNAAYMTPQTKAMKAAGHRGIERRAQSWTIAESDFFTDPETARGLFGELIGASADDIALVPAASYGIAVAAKNMVLKPGQHIVVLEGQFPSNTYSWFRLVEEQGVVIETVPYPEDRDWTAAILEVAVRLGDQIGAFALPHCHWANGWLLDLRAIGVRARALGAYLVLDVTQSLGALPLDVKEIDPDYLACGGYKWLFCPYGISFLYVAKRHQGGAPLEENWIDRKGSQNFAGLVDYVDEYQPGARRFDMGERASFGLMPQAIEALRQVLDWQVANIAQTLGKTNQRLSALFEQRGFIVPQKGICAGHLVGVEYAGGLKDTFIDHLRANKVFVSVRGNSVRLAPHLYIDEEAIDILARALDSSGF
jgi:selenocysteine lyase/cysteine desulfurase